jgi:hypothetical protein
MQAKFTILVETFQRKRYKSQLKEIIMVKKTKNGRDNVKVVPELGANAKGEQQGGIPVEMTDPFTSQEVDVRGTKRMRPDKKPVKATWY